MTMIAQSGRVRRRQQRAHWLSRATNCPTWLVRLAVALGIVLPPSGASAQIVAEPADPYPNPEHFARGLFLQGEAGVVIPLGVAHDSLSSGPALGLRAGYEFARWVALQAELSGSTHTVDVPQGPPTAQLLQITHVMAELRLAVPIGAWSIFAQGGGGRARLSTNVLGTTGLTAPGVHVSLIYGASGGVDYHTRSRHFSCGLSSGFAQLPAIATTGAVTTSLYLRHSF
jgi:hypothetical protein